MTGSSGAEANLGLGRGLSMDLELETARIMRLPNEAFYIPDFVTEEEETRLLHKINSAPLPTWKNLPTSQRRLQTYPSSLSNSNTLLASPLPPWLSDPILPRFNALHLFADAPHKEPNHVLVNEYTPSQGIMPHEDGGAYYPLVATVSLGGVVCLDLYPKYNIQGHEGENEPARQPAYRILQERRSLLVTRASIYRDYLHGIAEREKEENLTADSICNWDLLGDKEQFVDGWCMRGGEYDEILE
ncbi:hypothetical protein BDV18DRAFT_155338 [Aspergillus unguis]